MTEKYVVKDFSLGLYYLGDFDSEWGSEEVAHHSHKFKTKEDALLFIEEIDDDSDYQIEVIYTKNP